MKSKDFYLYTSLVFSVIFVVHGLRILLGWELMFDEWEVPITVSWAAVAVGGYLAYTGFKLSGHIK